MRTVSGEWYWSNPAECVRSNQHLQPKRQRAQGAYGIRQVILVKLGWVHTISHLCGLSFAYAKRPTAFVQPGCAILPSRTVSSRHLCIKNQPKHNKRKQNPRNRDKMYIKTQLSTGMQPQTVWRTRLDSHDEKYTTRLNTHDINHRTRTIYYSCVR